MPVDIIDAFLRKPEPLDFVIPGYLHGTVGAIFSAGGSGKSMLALEVAMAVASNKPAADLLGIEPQASGPVAYLAAEDPEVVLRHRIHDMTNAMQSEEAVYTLEERLYVEPMAGTETDLFKDEHLNAIADYAANCRLIIIDTISRFHSGDENSNAEMARLVNRMEKLSNLTGAAVLFLHHANKAAGRDGTDTDQNAIRGASSLIDNARWGAALRRMTEHESESLTTQPMGKCREPIGEDRGFYVRMDAPKNNYGSPTPTRWFHREQGGVLVPVELYDLGDSKPQRVK